MEVNGTHLNALLRVSTGNRSDHPQKVPVPDQNDTIKMLNELMETVKFDRNKDFKTLWVTSAPVGSEDFLVSDKIKSLAGESLRHFRNKLMSVNSIIPTKMDRSESVSDKNNEKKFLMHNSP